MNKTAKKILYVGISLIIIALLLLIYFEWEEIYSKKESNDIMKTILNNKDNNKNEDEIVIDDLKYIGYIVIPTLDLNLPISKEFSYSSLRKSPTLYYGSLMNNNMVICGHSYKSHFRYLYKLKQGDEVIFVDTKNNRYTYKVELVEELASTDIKEMIESNPKLKKLYLNSVRFPEFVEELRKYCNYHNHAENITQMQKNM